MQLRQSHNRARSPRPIRQMRIAQVAPLYESVPPKLYGGTERVVSYLTEELVAQGHDVTLFAAGDSVTKARLVASSPHALRLSPDVVDPLACHFVQLEQVFAHAGSFDVIHFHNDYLHYPLSERQNTPHLTTLHGRLDVPELRPLYEIFAGIPVVSISNAQRKPLSWANWQGTVYHGLPTDLYTGRQEHGRLPCVPGTDLSRKTTRSRYSNRSKVRHEAQGCRQSGRR
jgi:glycosyltransferase involved in cell wall biosynthesis